MTTGRILSVNLARPERSTAKNVGITGIHKRPVDRAVAVRAPAANRSGLVGDQIFDVQHHGGEDQAVYAYAREDYDWWEHELARSLPGGLFGENLTTTGVDVNGAVIGERWKIGATLVLETTFGRIPCTTFQAKMDEPHWVKRFTAACRPGAYLKVVAPGDVRSGDPIQVTDRPRHGVTIGDAFRAYLLDATLLAGYLAIPDLPPALRETLQKRAAVGSA